MKEVLFLSLASHDTLGGTQNYNYKLMNIFNDLGWKITEYNCNLGIDKPVRDKLKFVKTINNSSELLPSRTRFVHGRRFMRQVKTSNIEIANLLSKKKYDLIIDCRQHPYTWSKKWGTDFSKQDNTIWIQHFTLRLYDGKCLTGNLLEYFFIYLYTNKLSANRYNVLYSHKNIVLFDKFNEGALNLKRFKVIPKIYTISLSGYNTTYLKKQLDNSKDRDIDFLYVGRLNQVQKNLKFINSVFKESKRKLTIIGSGDDKIVDLIKKNKQIDYLGFKKQDELCEYFRRSKYLFMPSKYEGFPYVLVQALSHGCTPIIINTYESVNFFKDVCHIFDAKIKPIQIANELENIINQYDKNTYKKNIQFAINNLSDEIFRQQWINVIQQYK